MKARTNFEMTRESLNAAGIHIQRLHRRFKHLESLPGGRESLTPEQRIEYDLIGALFCSAAATMRNAIDARSAAGDTGSRRSAAGDTGALQPGA